MKENLTPYERLLKLSNTIKTNYPTIEIKYIQLMKGLQLNNIETKLYENHYEQLYYNGYKPFSRKVSELTYIYSIKKDEILIDEVSKLENNFSSYMNELLDICFDIEKIIPNISYDAINKDEISKTLIDFKKRIKYILFYP